MCISLHIEVTVLSKHIGDRLQIAYVNRTNGDSLREATDRRRHFKKIYILKEKSKIVSHFLIYDLLKHNKKIDDMTWKLSK